MELKNENVTINKVQKLYYRIILDYKAALFQGMKRGRNFLMYLQEELLFNNKQYSEELIFFQLQKKPN